MLKITQVILEILRKNDIRAQKISIYTKIFKKCLVMNNF